MQCRVLTVDECEEVLQRMIPVMILEEIPELFLLGLYHPPGRSADTFVYNHETVLRTVRIRGVTPIHRFVSLHTYAYKTPMPTIQGVLECIPHRFWEQTVAFGQSRVVEIGTTWCTVETVLFERDDTVPSHWLRECLREHYEHMKE